jgi:Leucine-rich repeat (LRR) protein
MANHLVSLPDNFGGLSSLVRLGLKSNKLQFLPDSFCKLGNLVELFITDNHLTTLPEGVRVCITTAAMFFVYLLL